MRMHIELDDRLVAEVDDVAGQRGRSAFVRRAVERELLRERQAKALRATAGILANSPEPHDWDDDPAAWVRAQRRSDPRRSG